MSSIAPVIASEGQADGSINGGSVNLDELDERNPASVVWVDGGNGRWEYGVGPVNVYSNHDNFTNNPLAKVKGVKADEVKTLKGIPAKAKAVKNPLGGNTAGWGTWK